jgi:molybdopterin converting factor small subunit
MIKVTVKGERDFGLPGEYVEVELVEPTLESIMEHFNVNPKIRKHLFPVVNNQISKQDRILQDGDVVTLQSPYSGG